MPADRVEVFVARAKRADDEADNAPTPELVRQWRSLAETYRLIADAFRRPELRSRTEDEGTTE